MTQKPFEKSHAHAFIRHRYYYLCCMIIAGEDEQHVATILAGSTTILRKQQLATTILCLSRSVALLFGEWGRLYLYGETTAVSSAALFYQTLPLSLHHWWSIDPTTA